jgi:hypothetical protein
LNKLLARIGKAVKGNPVLVAGAANVVIALAARYGVHVTADQLATVVSLATAALAGLTRHVVTPVRKAKPAPAAPTGQAS